MKFSIFSLFILAALVFSSCQKGDLTKDDLTKNDLTKDGDQKEEKGVCFELIYPVTYAMPDGSTITGNNEEEVWTAIKAWYEAHPDSAGKPVLQYPVEIVFPDGPTKTIANEEEMSIAKKDCADEKDGWKVCEWDNSKVSDPNVWEKYIVEPLVTDESCDCIVGGVVKYVKIGTDFAYVIYYGKGECDAWAYLVTYYDAADKKMDKCKFELNCGE